MKKKWHGILMILNQNCSRIGTKQNRNEIDMKMNLEMEYKQGMLYMLEKYNRGMNEI